MTSRVAKVVSGGRQKHLRYCNGFVALQSLVKNILLTLKFLSLSFLGYYVSNVDIKFLGEIQDVCKVNAISLWQIDG